MNHVQAMQIIIVMAELFLPLLKWIHSMNQVLLIWIFQHGLWTRKWRCSETSKHCYLSPMHAKCTSSCLREANYSPRMMCKTGSKLCLQNCAATAIMLRLDWDEVFLWRESHVCADRNQIGWMDRWHNSNVFKLHVNGFPQPGWRG